MIRLFVISLGIGAGLALAPLILAELVIHYSKLRHL